MKLKKRAILICWLAMLTIISLDLVTTIIAIEMLGCGEMNPFASVLFEIGLIGYPLVLISYAMFFYIFLILLGGLYKYSYKKITNKKLSIESEIFGYCLIASVYVLMDFITILSNIMIIVQLI